MEALGVTGEIAGASFVLLEKALAGTGFGGGRRFFLAAASRKLTSLGASSLCVMLVVLGGFKNGFVECGVRGVVRIRGWVCESGVLTRHFRHLAKKGI